MDKMDFSLFMDLHNHTIWSDGDDTIEDIILNAYHNHVEVVGMSDHLRDDGKRSLDIEKIKLYLNKINGLKAKCSNDIKVFAGIEISYSYLRKSYRILPYDLLNQLDYILLEDLDYIPASTPLEDVDKLLEGFKCMKGLAHTDLNKLSDKYINNGYIDYVLNFVKRNELFWEINIDSAHDMFLDILYPGRDNEIVVDIKDGIRLRKIPVSVGSDTHSLTQYNFGRLKAANEVARSLNMFIQG